MSAGGNTGIGHGSTYSSPKIIKGLNAAAIQTGPIGQSQTSQTLKALSTDTVAVGANKGLRYMAVGGADVANGGVIAAGWVNQSGKTMKAGETAFGVAA
jgi:hypothetical protein